MIIPYLISVMKCPQSSPDCWIVDMSGLKSKKIDDFRTNLEKKLDFSPDVSTYPTIGAALRTLFNANSNTVVKLINSMDSMIRIILT